MSGDASPMPPQQGLGRDKPDRATGAGERSRDSSEQGPVVIAEIRSIDPSTQHTKLVAQDDDLKVSGPARTDRKPGERDDKAIKNSVHKASASASIVPGQHPRPNIRPPQPSPVGEDFLAGQEWLRDHAARVRDQPDIVGAGDRKGVH